MDDRPLSGHERALLRWLLERGGEDARALLPQVDHARVVGRCACGCASVDLAVDGRPAGDAPMVTVTPDFFWTEPGGGLCGVLVFAKGGTLAGLEVWSVDGEATPTALPALDQLRPAEELPS
jgi:hypothetical protein